MYWPQLLIALQLFLVNCLIESASDQSLSKYLPTSKDDPNIEHLMQGGSLSSMDFKPPKLKTERIDVRAEIAHLNSTYVYQSQWPDPSVELGAVTAVSFDKAGNVVIFHRVDRIWDQTTFINDIFMDRHLGPIAKDPVLALDRKSGKIVYKWGKNLFYLPHGLTIDAEDNVWVTDVGLQQVFKFGPKGSSGKPLMTLGTAFTPGNSESKFCKPTSVAVLPNGDFFVADGYCNARIIKYSASGEQILVWGENSFAGEVPYDLAPKNYFAIPHALTLVPEQELVCTADRENGRIQCFSWTNGSFHSQYHSQIVGDRLFSMDYTPAEGGQFVVVNGPTGAIGISEHYNEVRGYIINMKTKQVVGKFGPNDLQFSNPHDVAVTTDGTEIYVAELNPTQVHKFLHKKLAPSLPMSAAKPTATSIIQSAAEEQQIQVIASKTTPGSTALLVAALMLFFAFLTFGMALLISRRRKRGCLPFGVKNRRHAWDFPTKPEGFKLGGLLDHRKRGFEKLDQNASDEEPDVTTNMLASPQFA